MAEGVRGRGEKTREAMETKERRGKEGKERESSAGGSSEKQTDAEGGR